MSETAEVPSTKRVELADGRWIELRTTRLVADARYQREQRHARGDYDDETLDELSLIEARIVAWSFGDKVPSDMTLRRVIIDALTEDDALKLVLANRGVEDGPKDSQGRSRSSSTGTRRKRQSAGSVRTNG